LIIKSLSFLALLMIIQVSFSSLSSYLNAKCSVKLSSHIQKKLYTHIINSKWQQQTKYHSGNLLAHLTSDVSIVTNVIVNTLPGIVSLIVLFISAFTALFHFDSTLALLSITIVPMCTLAGRIYAKKLKNIHKTSQEVEAAYRSFLQESMQNLIIVKTFCLEKENIKTLEEFQSSKVSLTLKRNVISIIANIFISVGTWACFFLVYGWGVINLSKGTNLYGTLTALLQLILSIQSPFLGLASLFPQLASSVGSAERLIQLEKMSQETRINQEMNNQLPDIFCPDIEFRDVSFSYTQDVPVLKKMSFSIQAGETIGILGSSGEGKTTIIRLLLSLIDGNEGQISICSANKRITVNPDTRSIISYVPQGNTLFSGTIKSNLLYGNINASEEEIQVALEAVKADDFVNSLNNKLDTIISEKGIGLSEGQAQRIAIARALLRKRPILILDEATSSLDSETELKVLHTIQNLDNNPTCIIVTHRTSALSICDRVFKLENGQLFEVGHTNNKETAIESA
jgi:ABC-type multidrug transport system fused ATPase/permease subunit